MPKDKYEEAMEYLYGLQRLGIKFGLGNITRVLQSIDSPHEKLPAIHIAGSNGKGSTAAHLESILIEAGYRAGFYSSPHFVRFTERIRINREPIEEEDVVHWTQAILEALPGLRKGASSGGSLPITFFEFSTAIAMAYFVEQQVDLAILEVGMGGRLDATNVCHPLLCMITNISLEHMDFLGNTISKIAREKAGIVKQGVPVITGVRQRAAISILEETCHLHEARMYRLGKEFRVRGKPENFTYDGIHLSVQGCRTSLRGRHQLRNAALAMAAAELLDQGRYRISDENLLKGLKRVQWRGRQEWHPGPPQILLDGAHNPEAMRSLCYSLKRDFHYRRLWVLMGTMKDKDHERMVALIAPLVHEFVFCRPAMERSEDPRILEAQALKLGCNASVVIDVQRGVEDLIGRADEGDMICVTGSLFVVGEVIDWMGKNSLQALRSMT